MQFIFLCACHKFKVKMKITMNSHIMEWSSWFTTDIEWLITKYTNFWLVMAVNKTYSWDFHNSDQILCNCTVGHESHHMKYLLPLSTIIRQYYWIVPLAKSCAYQSFPSLKAKLMQIVAPLQVMGTRLGLAHDINIRFKFR